MLLDVSDVTRTFLRRGHRFAAVDHVTFGVDAGQLVAVVGRSGNGKSTLLNIIAGLLKPSSGQVSIDGVVVDARNDRLMSRIRNESLGFVTQSATLLSNLCVLDNVVLPAKLRARSGGATDIALAADADQVLDGSGASDIGNAQTISEQAAGGSKGSGTGAAQAASDQVPDVSDRERAVSRVDAVNISQTPVDVQKSGTQKPDRAQASPIESANPAQASELETMIEQTATRQAEPAERRAMLLLERLDIADLAMCYPGELSGGELRRVAIARAQMNRPPLLVLDEPTGDLDAATTQLVMRELRRCADEGVGVLIVTHDPDALPAVDAIYRMDAGKLAKIV